MSEQKPPHENKNKQETNLSATIHKLLQKVYIATRLNHIDIRKNRKIVLGLFVFSLVVGSIGLLADGFSLFSAFKGEKYNPMVFLNANHHLQGNYSNTDIYASIDFMYDDARKLKNIKLDRFTILAEHTFPENEVYFWVDEKIESKRLSHTFEKKFSSSFFTDNIKEWPQNILVCLKGKAPTFSKGYQGLRLEAETKEADYGSYGENSAQYRDTTEFMNKKSLLNKHSCQKFLDRIDKGKIKNISDIGNNS